MVLTLTSIETLGIDCDYKLSSSYTSSREQRKRKSIINLSILQQNIVKLSRLKNNHLKHRYKILYNDARGFFLDEKHKIDIFLKTFHCYLHLQ